MLTLLMSLSGCLQEASQRCGNGGVCPPGLHCVEAAAASAAGLCVAGSCGDGSLDTGEVCDDGNNRSGDGCPADCTQPCGDRARDPGEVCDDGNSIDGDGCSADCRSLDGLFLVSPEQVLLTATEATALPPAALVKVRLQYPRDILQVGFAPGVPQPAWLSIAERPVVGNLAELELQVTDTAAVGTRSTSVRLTITHQEGDGPAGAGPEIFELPVSYHVAPSDLAVVTSPAALSFTATVGDPAVPPQPLEVTYSGERLTLVAAPPWATVTPPSPMTSPASFSVAINDTDFAGGTRLIGEIVLDTARGALQRRRRVKIDCLIVALPVLAIQAAPAALDFTAVAGGALPSTQPVQLTFTGTAVTLVSAPAWVTVSAPPLPATSPAVFQIGVNTTALPAGTVQSGDLVFRTTRGVAQQSATVPIVYRVQPAPEVQFVAPYVGVAGRAGTLLVRGRGFPTSGPVSLRLGELVLGPLLADSSTQLTVSYPALPEGRYPVRLLAAEAIAPMSPELVIVPPAPFAYQAVDSPVPLRRLVYDAERRALYGLNQRDQQLERFAYSGGTWARLTPHPVPELIDFAMAPNGRSLIVVAEEMIYEGSLSSGSFALVPRAPFPTMSSLCSYFSRIAPANNGKFLVNTEIRGSGSCPALLYDLRDHSLSMLQDTFYGGRSGSSADGSRVFARGGLSSSEPLVIYDARTETTSSQTLGFSGLYHLSVSRNASRAVLNDTRVYDGAFRLTGNLPYRGPSTTLMSREGSRVFVYAGTFGNVRLEIYDLNAPLETGALYPLLRSIALPDAANGDNVYAMAMASSPEDAVVFVAGEGKLLVIPLD